MWNGVTECVWLIRYDAERRPGKDKGCEALAIPPPVDRLAHRIRRDLRERCT